MRRSNAAAAERITHAMSGCPAETFPQCSIRMSPVRRTGGEILIVPPSCRESATWDETMRGLTISRYVAAGVAASIAMANPWYLRRAAADEPNADVAALTKAVLDGKDFRM